MLAIMIYMEFKMTAVSFICIAFIGLLSVCCVGLAVLWVIGTKAENAENSKLYGSANDYD